MADAAVEFLLETLKQLLLYSVDLIRDVKSDVESLYNELDLLKGFLKDSTEKRNSNEYMKSVARQTREVVYNAEDAVETFVSLTSVPKTKSYFEKALHGKNYVANLRNVAEEVKSIMTMVKNMYDSKKIGFAALQYGEGSERITTKRKVPIVEEENVVGFQDEAEKLIKLLNEGLEELEVISIIGMPGLGKTTLAKIIFRDPKIEYEFYNRAWVYVSQEYSKKEVFLKILGQLIKLTDDMYKMDAERLANELHRFLEKGKYLIVMDDVWKEYVWDDLKLAFPKNKNRSRILMTSRILSVGKHANPNRDPHCLRFLTPHESWKSLQQKALGTKQCLDQELIEHGKRIAKECEGLPLAIGIIGGVLLGKGIEIYWWEKVAGRVHAYLNLDREERMDKLIALSFQNLPYHLKACFLYFGMFPEDFEIPVSKLLQLWTAEGFIQKEEGMNLEDIAEEYLEDLVNRNLVMVGKWKSNGKVKICHIHDMLHEFCKKEGAEQNFFYEIKEFNRGTYSFSSTLPFDEYRRLGVHSGISNFISSKQFGPRVRSLLCFSGEDITLSLDHVSSIPGSFKLLRVLDGRPITFPRFPSDLTQLIHLRYLVLSIAFQVLPTTISNLRNLQTLIVVTSLRTLEIKADIWKMIQLRHLEINASTSLPKTGKSKEDSLMRLPAVLTKTRKCKEDSLKSGSLVTLSTISPESCSEDVFAAAPNLKKLGIRGQLFKLLGDKGGSTLFDSLGKILVNLENLKLMNDVFPGSPAEGKLSLPQMYKFPPKLNKLTLSDTLLDWKHMSTLGKLENLEILKLKDNAFEGIMWQPEEGGFRALRILHIGKTNLVSWNASADHFPKLWRLYLKHCSYLYEVPSGLGDISSLQIMDLYCTSKSAAASARKIELLKKNFQDQQSTKGSGFKLNIYPPDAPAKNQ
ncbi:late blight resistance homolog R1B-17 [Olea europaea subsp. europaea]|uniref:Late blight resistance homolog R1B-17 n=1 Tax=Olea europaea subsp. europaea TaxID=158383 RepID=A0A8S0SRD0_OLEEU|nr:late blight resistance homolog R1B-17 [Olea europaea subsp. europaea]